MNDTNSCPDQCVDPFDSLLPSAQSVDAGVGIDSFSLMPSEQQLRLWAIESRRHGNPSKFMREQYARHAARVMLGWSSSYVGEMGLAATAWEMMEELSKRVR